ncbi:MAG: autotransporter outer membrane beta-barrel domain-containing protein [Thermoguttaceae bacterium]
MKKNILLTAAVAVALSVSFVGSTFAQYAFVHNPFAIRQATQDRMTQNFFAWGCAGACGGECGGNGCGTGCTDNLGCGDVGCGDTGCGDVCGTGFNKLSGAAVWGNYVGRNVNVGTTAGISNGADFKANGFQIGWDMYSDRCTQFGVMFGYENVKFWETAAASPKADDYYFGFYGARKFGNGYDVRGVMGYGHQQIRADAVKAKGNTFETTVELGKRIYMTKNLSYRPVVAFDLYDGGLKVDDTDVSFSSTLMYNRYGSDLQWNCGRLNLNAGAYYSFLMSKTSAAAIVPTDLTDPTALASAANTMVSMNAGINYQLNKNWSAFGNYYADGVDSGNGVWQNSVLVGLDCRF